MSNVVEIAKNWVGRQFAPGKTEQCMAFVRHVLNEARHPLAQKVTKAPVDGLDTSFYLASSLAGRDLGAPLVDKIASLTPGSILFWQDTYGNWPRGTITHVGIFVGNGRFVHRPTVSRPVVEESLAGFWQSLFRCGLNLEIKPAEPAPFKPLPAAPPKLKLFFKEGRLNLVATENFTLKAGETFPVEFFTGEIVLRDGS